MNKILIELDSRIYSKNGIVKCLYWYSNDFHISIKIERKDFYEIILISNSVLSKSDLKKVKAKIEKELIDYNLRDIVKQETSAIRELIIAKAFSNGEYDEEPRGDLLDPLGIKFL